MVTTPITSPEQVTATEVIQHLNSDVLEAKDNLLQAKVFQAHYANKHRQPEIRYNVGDKVMLSTLHHQHQYKKKNEH
jgi:translation initiation factor IF-1